MRSSSWRLLALGAAAALGLLLSWSPAGRQFDLWFYDGLMRLLPPALEPSRSLIVAIDEETLEAFGGPLRLREPLARGLTALAEHEPAAVAVDVILSEPRAEPDDALLETALAATPNVALAASLRVGVGSQRAAWEKPLERFARRAAALGHVHAEPDEDGVCRRVLTAKVGGRERLWALAVVTYRLAQGGGPIEESDSGLRLGGRTVPASARSGRELLIRFPNPRAPVERISLKRLLDDPSLAVRARGRAVFIGVLVLGGLDRYLMTPYSDGRPMAGVEINAAVYETLARGEFLVPARPSTALACAALFSLALGAAFRLGKGRANAAAILAPGLILAAAHAAPFLFFRAGTVYPASEAIFPAWAVFLVGAALEHGLLGRRLGRSERQKERYEKAIHYVTHEMRTPLTTIQGSSELIRRPDLSEEQRKRIGELIHGESRRLGRMVEMFLGVERLAAGKLQLRLERMRVDEVLAACVERIRPIAERKGIRVEHERNPEAAASADREFIEYACYNLVSNAVKYSPAKTAVIVRARREGRHTLVSVSDQGYGLEPDDLRKIFQKFYRASTARRSGESGSGLGLALVEEIVVQHGGSVRVESEPGRGSCFTIVLPAAETPARPSPSSVQEA